MESMQSFLDAISRGEVIAFLEGDWPYKMEASYYVTGSEPIYIRRVLSNAVYEAYKKDKSVKPKLEQALLNMLEGDTFNVYVASLYGISQRINEEQGISPFEIDDELMPEIRRKLIRNKDNFRMGVAYRDGYYKSDAWGEIVKYNDVCHYKYGFEVI